MLEQLRKISSGLRYLVLPIVLTLFLAIPMDIQSTVPIKLLLNFGDIDNSGRWMVVNDTVMGGVSRSNVNLHSDGYLLFAGEVSTDYGGGFASVKTYLENLEISKYEGFILRVKGDGKTYQFRCRMGDNTNEISYRNYFQANNKNWQEILLPFKDFLPTYRGRVLTNVPQLDPKKIKQFGFMISDKQVGNFNLEIDWIGVY
jgi:hypothetical protein